MTGVTALEAPMFLEVKKTVSAEEMYQEVIRLAPRMDVIIKAAAVADYRPSEVAEDKIKKSDGKAQINLERTRDILAELGRMKSEGKIHSFLCGFSMETRDLEENSKAKLEKKNLDMIAANNLKVEGAGFGTDTNVVTLITRKDVIRLERMDKAEVALEILNQVRDRG